MASQCQSQDSKVNSVYLHSPVLFTCYMAISTKISLLLLVMGLILRAFQQETG